MGIAKNSQEKGPAEFCIRVIGLVRSSLKDRSQCPHQEHEGAPQAWIEIEPQYSEGLDGLEVGDEILVLSWMHLGDRTRLRVHPRGNPDNPLTGVFATRSPSRPNPIGLHKTRILAIEAPCRILVESLELLDQTPVVDIKPVL
jgi:tRNA-Thr(GGU) m(6)t(6)A37 methyltransferase TsaA